MKDITDRIAREWADRHGLDRIPTSTLRCAISDARTIPELATVKPHHARLTLSIDVAEQVKEDRIRDALVRLGWTPPAGEGPVARVTDAMVRRFLAWRLPETFSPDCYIRFDRDGLKKMANGQHWPVGTNLLTYEEAKAMLEHCLGDSHV